LALLDEGVLRNPVGGYGVLAGQLQYLVEAAARPNITILVIPKMDRGHPGQDGPFIRFHLPNRFGAIALPNRIALVFLEEKVDTRYYDEVAADLHALALGQADSVDLISDLAAEAKGRST
jgi:hypothetical protein